MEQYETLILSVISGSWIISAVTPAVIIIVSILKLTIPNFSTSWKFDVLMFVLALPAICNLIYGSMNGYNETYMVLFVVLLPLNIILLFLTLPYLLGVHPAKAAMFVMVISAISVPSIVDPPEISLADEDVTSLFESLQE